MYIKGADKPKVIRQTKAMYGIAQDELGLSGPGSAKDVVNALWRICQGGRICTASQSSINCPDCSPRRLLCAV